MKLVHYRYPIGIIDLPGMAEWIAAVKKLTILSVRMGSTLASPIYLY
jgi:hypothetical protein